jgi:hypothetical protein
MVSSFRFCCRSCRFVPYTIDQNLKLNNSKNIRLSHDQIILTVDLDLGTGVLTI